MFNLLNAQAQIPPQLIKLMQSSNLLNQRPSITDPRALPPQELIRALMGGYIKPSYVMS